MKNNTQMYAIAKKYLGKGGAVFRRYCGLPSNAPYCCAYVTYIFHEGGDSALFYGGKKVVYCPSAIQWCDAHLALVPPYLALPMDIIFFDWNGNNTPDHIGFVKERKSCDAIYTLEGNTSGGIVDTKVRNTKYVEGIYRPHYPAKFDISKPLEIDGLFGYNSIAMLQKALGGLDIDGILGKATVKKLQKWAGVPQDGAWGKKTSKAIQRKLGITADGLFGKESCKALQKWCNSKTKKSSPKPSPSTTWVDNANAWVRKIAKEKYHYVRWKSGDAKTHTCPICKGRKYDDHYGGNCIWLPYAAWHHGGKLGNKCNCGVIDNAGFNKLLTLPQAKANKYASDRIGKPVEVIRNGGKSIPLSMLKAGDICMLYRGSTYYHTIYYMGNGKYAESNTAGGIGSAKNIRADLKLSATAKANLKCAIRYNGK